MQILKYGLFEDVIEHYKKRLNLNEDYKRFMGENNDILMLIYTLPEGHVLEEHFHDWIEMTLVLSGEQHIWVEENEYILTEGDFLIIDYEKIHHSIAIKNTDTITFQFKSGFIENIIPEFDSSKIYCTTTEIKDTLDYYVFQTIIELFCYMVNTYEKTAPKLGIDFYGYFHLFIYYIIQQCSITTEEKEKHSKNTYIKQLLSFINKHYSENINLQVLSDTFHLSPEYISRIIKSEIGKGFKDYLIHLRLDHAVILMKNTSKTLLSISEECGFSNNKSFIKYFKEKYKVSPSEYRKNLK